MSTSSNGNATVAAIVVNPGSSSLKWSVFSGRDVLKRIHRGHVDGNGEDALDALAASIRHFAGEAPPLFVIRFVHGGNDLHRPAVIDHDIHRELVALQALAPLHNAVSLACVERIRTEVEGARCVAVFDTAFFHDVPEVAKLYALPRELVGGYRIRRFGFHGFAHAAMASLWRERHGGCDAGRLITLQLGAGCSISAIRDGLAVDNSMGFTPNEGLVMATRSGSVDPGLLTWLQQRERLDGEALDRLLNERSGLLGLSGVSADAGTLLEYAEPWAHAAIDLYCYRIRQAIGANAAVLGGVDGVVFGGGVGTHSPAIRARSLEGLQFLGLELDTERNRDATSGCHTISTDGAAVEVLSADVDEEREMLGEIIDAALLDARLESATD